MLTSQKRLARAAKSELPGGQMLSAERLLETLRVSGIKLIVAESITGGALAAEIVSVPGASEVFVGGVVAYDSRLKISQLGVDQGLLEKFGPVSLEVASQMAQGAQRIATETLGCSRSQVLAISTTGVAGPTEQGQPVGKVFLGLALGEQTLVFEHDLSGDRASIRAATTAHALSHALDLFA